MSAVLLSLCVWLFRVRPVWALWVLAVTFTMVGVVPSSRYLLPLMPLLLLAWWNLARYVNLRLGRRYGFLVAGAMISLLVPGMIRSWGTVWYEQTTRPFVARYHHGKFEGVEDMAELIRRNTPPDALIVCGDSNAGILTYLTRRDVVETWDPVVSALAPRPVFIVIDARAPLRGAMLRNHGLRRGRQTWTTPDYHPLDQVPLTLCSTSWRDVVLAPATSPATRPASDNALPR